MPEVLHIIDRLDMGGGTRSALAAAKYSTVSSSYRHSIVALRPSEENAIKLATESGVIVHHAPGPQFLMQLLEKADIVQVEYWNAPAIQRFLQGPLPEMRLVFWYHIAGDGSPQIITPELAMMPDLNVACNPYTYEELPVFRDLPGEPGRQKKVMAIDPADFDRLRHVRPRTHKKFNVGYIGTVDFVKMHPEFVAMSAAVDIPDVQFIVCGKGIEQQLMQQAAHLGASDRFSFKGYVEDIGSIISKLDVYGYPLCEDTYAAAELNLQEVMYAGIPPVVFPHGGVKRLVEDKKTGLVVHTAEEYSQAIEYLYKNPEVREELGKNAAEYAREHFGGENAAKVINPSYDGLMGFPKRFHKWGTYPTYEPHPAANSRKSTSQLFIDSLGHHASPFVASRSPVEDAELIAAERDIANASYLVFGTGIRPYRIADPADLHLRIWAGLYLENKKNYPEALQEYAEALKMSKRSWRLQWYCARTLFSLGKIKEAQSIYDKLRRLKPDFNQITGDTRCLPRSLPPSREKVRVSAIVSTYNASDFIEGCLQDLIAQTLFKKGELEIIVIDSGSEENEKGIVQQYAQRFPNIMYMRTPNRETLYKSWNRGIKLASGDYITNANTDDRHRKDAFEIMAGFLDNNSSISLVYPRQIETSTPHETFATTQSRKLMDWPIYSYEELERHCIIGSQPMWRASLHEEYGLFREELKSAGDYEFWLRIGKKENFYRHPDVLGLYLRNPEGIEHSSTVGEKETIAIWEEYGMFERGVATILKGQLYRPQRIQQQPDPYQKSKPAQDDHEVPEPLNGSEVIESPPFTGLETNGNGKEHLDNPVALTEAEVEQDVADDTNPSPAEMPIPDSSSDNTGTEALEMVPEIDIPSPQNTFAEELEAVEEDADDTQPKYVNGSDLHLKEEDAHTLDAEQEVAESMDLGDYIEAFQDAFINGDMSGLRKVAFQAVADHGDQPYPYILKAMTHRISNEFNEAFETLQQSLEIEHTDEAIRELKQLLSGNPPADLRKAIKGFIKLQESGNEMIIQHDSDGNLPAHKGTKELETEAECLPESVRNDFHSYLNQSNIQEASRIALSAIREFPAAPEAWILRARSLRLEGDSGEAHRAIEQSLSLEDTPEALYELLEIKLARNSAEDAEQIATFIKQHYPAWISQVEDRMQLMQPM